MKGHGILQIRKPFGKATLLIFTFTALLILLFELFASSTYAQPLNLPYQSIDSNLDDLEIKLSLLKAFVEENGQLECLLLGSSEINGGIDPDVLSNAFAEVTGAHLNCFKLWITWCWPHNKLPGCYANISGAQSPNCYLWIWLSWLQQKFWR